MKKKTTAVVGLFVGFVMLSACGGKKNQTPPPPPPTPVTVVAATLQNATYFDEFPATVTAVNEVEIRPQVAGYITGVYFQEGKPVRKGQKLYSIDQQQYRAGYDQAVANLNAAKADLVRSQKDADRYNTLAQQDAVARQLVDNAQATLASSQQQVAAAEAGVQQVATTLRYATIYAPFDGTIGISQVKLGTAVSPGQTILNTISSDNPIAADIAIDQATIPRFTQMPRTPGRDSTFKLLLADGSLYRYPGYIGIIDRAVDPQTGTLRVRLFFPNPNEQLRSGLTANVRVKNQTKGPQLLIPYKAVTEQMSEYFVYVAEGAKVVQKKVSLGPRLADRVIVISGLREGERVVTEGTQKLRDGAAIRVVPAGDSANVAGQPGSPKSASPAAQGPASNAPAAPSR